MPPTPSPHSRLARSALAAGLALAVFSVVLQSCGFPTPNQPPEEIDNYCEENPDDCPPCESDDECVVTGNACIDDPPNCHHQETMVTYPSIGCNRAYYEMPPDSACDCVDSTCRADR